MHIHGAEPVWGDGLSLNGEALTDAIKINEGSVKPDYGDYSYIGTLS
ncbi:MAG: hypothetical protein JNL22_16815 [Bacteroidales bacterium]|nr:hypothetical protein [Bacteroidales bacterium]